MFSLGFPCTPFSVLNIERFLDGYDPFRHPDAGPVFNFLKYIHKPCPTKPKIAILENVQGLLQPFRNKRLAARYKNPMEYLLFGECTVMEKGRKKIKFKHAIANLADYSYTFFSLDARCSGLPMRRRRVFLVLVRNDLLLQSGVQVGYIGDLVKRFKANPLSREPLSNFMVPEYLRIDRPQKARKVDSKGLSEKGWKYINLFRKKYNLPLLGPSASRNCTPVDIFSNRDIFSEDQSSNLQESLSKRELEVLRCVLDMYLMNSGEIPAGLAVNVNESIHRKPWGVDKLYSVSTGTRTYLHSVRKLINFSSYMRIFGWSDTNRVELPHGSCGTIVRTVGLSRAVGASEGPASPTKGGGASSSWLRRSSSCLGEVSGREVCAVTALHTVHLFREPRRSS